MLSWCYKLYVGLFFASTLMVFYPFIYLTLLKKGWRKWSFPIHVVWSFLFRILCFVWVHRIQKAKLPKAPYILIANHTSYFDLFVMYSLFPANRFLFLGKSEILTYPLVKTFFKKLNIPVYRNDRVKAAKSFIQAKNALNEGWSLVIFPEGGIPDTQLPQMASFKEGAFKLAKSAQCPLVPITFVNHFKLFSEIENWKGMAQPGISKIYIHQAVLFETYGSMSESEVAQYTYDIIAEPLREKGYMK